MDFVLGETTGIEVKSAERVGDRDLMGLRALAEEVPLERKLVVSDARRPWRTEDGIEVLPVDNFLRQLGSGELGH